MDALSPGREVAMQDSNGFWRVRRRCETLTLADFVFAADELRAPAENEITIHTRHIALDPYLARAMRNWTGEVPEWADGTIHGRIVGEVLSSQAPGYAVGDTVLAIGRWQAVQTLAAARAEVISPAINPPRLALGVLGRSGMTAWVGLHLARPSTGETLLVSAASGPVGSVVGQLGKARGLRVVGTAGGADKCAYVVDTLGFDACLDHRDPDLTGRIAAAAPEGIDILFENVGAPSLDAALPTMAQGGRIMLCGLAAHYNDEAPLALTHFKTLLYRALALRGFITAEHPKLFEPALAELADGVASGAIVHRETIIDRLEQAPAAYLNMLQGAGIGKRLIRL
jgi:NADPH-dependent curcumin reductase CurA